MLKICCILFCLSIANRIENGYFIEVEDTHSKGCCLRQRMRKQRAETNVKPICCEMKIYLSISQSLPLSGTQMILCELLLTVDTEEITLRIRDNETSPNEKLLMYTHNQKYVVLWLSLGIRYSVVLSVSLCYRVIR